MPHCFTLEGANTPFPISTSFNTVSDCTIVMSWQHLYQTIVQFDKTIVLPRKQEVYMTTPFATAPQWYSIWGTENWFFLQLVTRFIKNYTCTERVIPCNKWLYNIKIKESAICNHCNEVDDIPHFFFLKCSKVKEFWTWW